MSTSTTSEDGVDALINTFNTQIFVLDEIEDARENTDTHHFEGHGRTSTQGTANFAERDPLASINTLITTPQPLPPLTLKLPSQKPRTALRLSVLVPSSAIFSLSLGTHVGK